MKNTLVWLWALGLCQFSFGQKNLIQNGDFEQGLKGFETDYRQVHATYNALYGEGTLGISGPDSRIFHDNLAVCYGDAQKQRVLVNGAQREATIFRFSMTVKPKEYYALSFKATSISPAAPARLQWFVDGKPVGSIAQLSGNTCIWKTYETHWQASSQQKTVRLELRSLEIEAAGNDFALDDLKMTVFTLPKAKKKEEPPVITKRIEYISDSPKVVKPAAKIDLKKGEKIVLEKIQFQRAQYNLNPAATAELDRIGLWLHEHPTVHIELSGHTSGEGNREDNLTLSRQRAEACRTYLLEQYKIEDARITAKGYGPDKPLVSNEDKVLRAKNRRVEMRFLE